MRRARPKVTNVHLMVANNVINLMGVGDISHGSCLIVKLWQASDQALSLSGFKSREAHCHLKSQDCCIYLLIKMLKYQQYLMVVYLNITVTISSRFLPFLHASEGTPSQGSLPIPIILHWFLREMSNLPSSFFAEKQCLLDGSNPWSLSPH